MTAGLRHLSAMLRTALDLVPIQVIPDSCHLPIMGDGGAARRTR